jgi:predicted small lipoprotein YifL
MRPVLVLLAVSLFLLAACGQKGPLYRPGDNAEPADTERGE